MSRFYPHVTVASVIERDGRFLLVRERIDGQIRINQPAGHLEPDETLTQAACREALEETGWHIKPTGVIGTQLYKAPANGETYLRTTFIASPEAHDPTRELDHPIIDTAWLTREQIAAEWARLRSPMVLEVVDAYLAGTQFPLAVVEGSRL